MCSLLLQANPQFSEPCESHQETLGTLRFASSVKKALRKLRRIFRSALMTMGVAFPMWEIYIYIFNVPMGIPCKGPFDQPEV